MDESTFQRPEGLKVTYRRMKFAFEGGFDRYWHGGSAFRSLWWTQLSTAFEPGEKFFIDSARALKSEIKDPALLEEIAEFCRQEGHHTAQHLKFDRINAAMGIDIEGCRRRYAKVLDRARANMTPVEMLSATVALEHFTACFAGMFFETAQHSEGADPNVIALWAWHAAEEAEHKATCYDIYKTLHPSYLERITIMLGAWIAILWVAMLNTTILLWKDKKLWSMDTLKGLVYLFGRKGLITGLAPAFFAYFSPRFHPWKEDNAHHIREWETKNAHYIVQRASQAPG